MKYLSCLWLVAVGSIAGTCADSSGAAPRDDIKASMVDDIPDTSGLSLLALRRSVDFLNSKLTGAPDKEAESTVVTCIEYLQDSRASYVASLLLFFEEVRDYNATVDGCIYCEMKRPPFARYDALVNRAIMLRQLFILGLPEYSPAETTQASVISEQTPVSV